MTKKNPPKNQESIKENVESPEEKSVCSLVPPQTAFNRIKKANALTGILSNKEFIKLVSSLEEGDYLLEIFAQAVESSLEGMFTNGTAADQQVKEKVSNLATQVDVAYAKMQAMSSSPMQLVLDRLLQNLGASLPAPQQPRQPPPQDYFADQPSARGQGVMGF